MQPLHAEAELALRSLQGGDIARPIRIGLGTIAAVCEGFRRIVSNAGTDYGTIHDLRRTFCTDLARLRVNQLVVQPLAGHTSPTTTAKFYQFIDDGTKRQAIERLTKDVG